MEEYLDLYDENRNITGEKILRTKGKPEVPTGRYITIVLAFIQNSDNKFLIQKTSKEKGSIFATTGGFVKSGSTSLDTVKIEVLEELGIDIDKSDFKLFKTYKKELAYFDVYYLKKDIDISTLKLQEEEVENVSWLSIKEIQDLIKEDNFRKGNIEPFNELVSEYLGNMEEYKLVTINEDENYLRQMSKKISIKDKNINKYIKVLEDYCTSHEVMAMAAVQLSIPKRMIYLKNTDLDRLLHINDDTATEEEKSYNEARILLNPVIIKREGLTEYWEACASCKNKVGHVRRPYKITVEYYDINEEKHIDIFEGFESTVLSHEMDHLDGILHMDIAMEVLEMSKEERKEYIKTHGYNIISETGDFEDLNK
ncbi:MAG: peptide deformylase [Bacilli bacterium]|nr:peptide deformylase [Bacilli bacterium]